MESNKVFAENVADSARNKVAALTLHSEKLVHHYSNCPLFLSICNRN
jgi:hypothetical protein